LITIVRDHGIVLKVDGQLNASDVTELSRACQSAQGSRVLDLAELQSADCAGLEILRELVSSGAQIKNASPYIELLLKSHP
jgi:ABC-type transporter Mla MlaB component